MSTLLQKELAQEIVRNIKRAPRARLNKTELLLNVGYKDSVAKHKQSDIIERVGVRKELSALGFNVDNAKRVIAQILDNTKSKDRDRINAAKEVFAVSGEYAPEKHLVVTKRLIAFDE